MMHKSLTQVPTLLSLSFPSRDDFQHGWVQAADSIPIGGLYRLAADQILLEIIKLRTGWGGVQNIFRVLNPKNEPEFFHLPHISMFPKGY